MDAKRLNEPTLNLRDEKDPYFMFQGTDQDLLIRAIKGEIDLVWQAKREMAARGLDLNGKWIGFKAAKKLHLEGPQGNEDQAVIKDAADKVFRGQ